MGLAKVSYRYYIWVMEHLTIDQRDQIRAFIAEKRTQNGFLRLNGAESAARRGDDILAELETLLAGLPEREFSVAEASNITGMHVESIRRGVREGRWGRQTAKKHGIVIPEAHLKLMRGRKRTQTRPNPTQQDAASHAAALLSG